MGKQLRLASRTFETPRSFDFIILLPEIYPKEIRKMERCAPTYIDTDVHLSTSCEGKLWEIFLIFKITGKIWKMTKYPCNGDVTMLCCLQSDT